MFSRSHVRVLFQRARLLQASSRPERLCRHPNVVSLLTLSHNNKPARALFATQTTTTTTTREEKGEAASAIQNPLKAGRKGGKAADKAQLPNHLLFRYLDLEQYSNQEFEQVFERIRQSTTTTTTTKKEAAKEEEESRIRQQAGGEEDTTLHIDLAAVQSFFEKRLTELEQEGNHVVETEKDVDGLRHEFCVSSSQRIWSSLTADGEDKDKQRLSKDDLVRILREKASTVDVKRMWPVMGSMVLVGASVGVITPAMPFVVERLSLTASEYGMIVSAFALAKMAANIPSAIAVERHGRQPYMVYSLGLIALGVGGIGLAASFEELYLCRLMTGVGVSLLSGAGTLMVTDLSTPLNRASTMAPIMSGFSAGTALGPALGGILVDSIGLDPTFYVVGVSYLGVAALNRVILEETQRRPLKFEWRKAPSAKTQDKDSLSGAVQNAVGQWIPLMRQPLVQSILVMNGFYWFALAGGQMTLLPLILTDEMGVHHMTATEVGRVYMGMSLVQIFGNPIFARFIDRIGKAPAIVAGCTLISFPMAAVPLCQDVTQLAGVLGIWAVGSSMLSTAPLAYMSDEVDEKERAQAIALMRTCGDVGFLVGASAIGAFADWAGSLDTAMQASAGVLLSATAWFGSRQQMTMALTAKKKDEATKKAS